MRIAYLDCFAGISGDMTLGALVDAGVDFEALKSELNKLGLHEFELKAEKVVCRGISATHVDVELHTHHHHHESDHGHGHSHHAKSHGRSFTEIKRIIEESGLSESVKTKAVAIFTKLGEAEAKIHGKDIEEIHFHEVGAVDAIVDIVGACIGFELLGVDKIYASPIPTFTGMVEMAHGMFPLPAPATAEILKGIPWRKLDIEGELVTPTGAAIISTLAAEFGGPPQMTVESIGYGAGTKDFGIPNVLRLIVGEAVELENTDESSYRNVSPSPQPSPLGAREHVSASTKEEHHDHDGECREVAVIETNIDDLSPQLYEVIMERLFAAGALDVYLNPIQMKKNRPAILLSVICAPGDVDKMSDILFEETSTIGLRIDFRKRICLPREIVKVKTKFGEIKVKVARRAGKIVNAHPEYEDCKAAAANYGVPIKLVRDTAVVEFYSRG